MTPEPQANTKEAALEIQADEFAEAFAFVDDIPAELIENSTDEELMDYVQAMDVVQGQTTKPGVATRADVLGCSAAIATAIAGVAFPAFKVGKVIRIVHGLGGPRATAEKIKDAGGLGKVAGKKANEENVSGMLASLAAELSGVDGIRKNCF